MPAPLEEQCVNRVTEHLILPYGGQRQILAGESRLPAGEGRQ